MGLIGVEIGYIVSPETTRGLMSARLWRSMRIKSVFNNLDNIPIKYTADGENVNPVLEIEDLPPKTKSIALIMDDPDALSGTFTHWLIWNINPLTKRIDENSVPNGAILGVNDAGNLGYTGPAPPSGIHRYQFKVYALDIKPDLEEGASREELENALIGHTLAETMLVGLYTREKSVV